MTGRFRYPISQIVARLFRIRVRAVAYPAWGGCVDLVSALTGQRGVLSRPPFSRRKGVSPAVLSKTPPASARSMIACCPQFYRLRGIQHLCAESHRARLPQFTWVPELAATPPRADSGLPGVFFSPSTITAAADFRCQKRENITISVFGRLSAGHTLPEKTSRPAAGDIMSHLPAIRMPGRKEARDRGPKGGTSRKKFWKMAADVLAEQLGRTTQNDHFFGTFVPREITANAQLATISSGLSPA